MQPFSPTFRITPAMASDLSKIDQAKGFLEGLDLSSDWVRLFEVNRRTLQRDLASLVNLGLITTTGATSSLRYRLV